MTNLFEEEQSSLEIPPNWHFRMLNDKLRNEAYCQSLKRCIKPESVVLDLGAGCGLLSLLAAKLGAKHVYAIERNSILCESLKEHAIINGLKNKITVINKHSSDVNLLEDIKEKANILVTEIFDGALVGEDCLKSINYVKQNFLVKHGVVIPQKGSIQCAPITSEQIRFEYQLNNNILDLNFSHFQRNCRIYEDRIRIKFYDHSYLGNSETLISIDFNENIKEVIDHSVSFKIQTSGIIDGLLVWFKLTLDDLVLENSSTSSIHWGQWLLVPKENFIVKKGDRLFVNINNNKGYLKAENWSLNL